MSIIDKMEKRINEIAFITVLLGLIAPYVDHRFNLFFWYHGKENYDVFVYKIFDISLVQYLLASCLWTLFLAIPILLISYVFFKIKYINVIKGVDR
ncbi:hypothetical protein ACNSOL_11610 (plasmid) [Aliarcobacter lanthieri]|uniref:hypothetical protein n=1 Tax=Aliarcobacter lanthieri TaxID=1355374 RepID=UPI003AADA022